MDEVFYTFYCYIYAMKKVFLFWIFPLFVWGQNSLDTSVSTKISLIFGGDIMCHGPQLRAAYKDSLKNYDFYENYAYLQNIFSNSDFSILNLETTIGVKPYSGYPQFSAPPELLTAAKSAGINVLMTANNHSCDKGKKGIVSTLNFLDNLELKHTGTFRDKKEADSLAPLILEKNGIKIALVNYTYGTNGIPVPYPTRVNLIDTIKIKKDLARAKVLKPDIIIAFLHWGIQYKNYPSKKQKQLADFLHKNGVKIVIGSHPHVIQPIELRRDSLNKISEITVFSLGNFISNQRTFPRDGSMLVKFSIEKLSDGKITIEGFETIPLWVYKFFDKNKAHYLILPVKDFILQPDFFEQNTDYQKMMKFYKHYQSFKFNTL